MRLYYRLPPLSYMLDSVCRLADGDGGQTGEFYPDILFQFYPRLDKRELINASAEQRRECLSEHFGEIYRGSERQMGDRAAEWQVYWDRGAKEVTGAFEEVFELSLERQLRRACCNITLNPACPRDLERQSFDLFWLNSARGACGLAMHELAHIIWFIKWHERFGDAYENYRPPNLKWVFSEMVMDALLSHPTLAELNPYKGRCCPEYFYAITLEGQPLLERIGQLFRENDIISFMEKGFKLCIANEKIIRSVLY